MFNRTKWIASFFSFFLISAVSVAQDWREVAISDSETLAAKIEILDELAHELANEESVVTKIHHFEETVLDFIDELQQGVSFVEASQEFSHVGQDLVVIYHALKADGLLDNLELLQRWNETARAFSKLSRVFYCKA